MTQQEQKLDAHARPPDELKAIYKKYQKLRSADLKDDSDLLDFRQVAAPTGLTLAETIDYRKERKSRWTQTEHSEARSLIDSFLRDCDDGFNVYRHPDMPGLEIIPRLFPKSSQKELLDLLLHRDVSNPVHQSNVHLHHHVQYPPENASFFSMNPSSDIRHPPKDNYVHKPIGIRQFLNKKLRWITLGGQYDWTNKIYPTSEAPKFPPDVADFLHFLFPEMTPQAAIVNMYSPGDTLSLHRDVAEECSQGLISVSIGCDAIFILGIETQDGCKSVTMRLRSGDAIFMSGESRFAWHGVPQIIPNTCPEWLQDWPGDEYEHWKGWMASKRINLNVRQMFE